MIKDRLAALRGKMKSDGIDAYIIPSGDPHSSEYVTDRWECRQWISGFHGSAGTAVVTADKACLWADSRYYLSAEAAVKETEYELHKMGLPGVPTVEEWISKTLSKKQVVGLAGGSSSVAQVRKIEKGIRDAKLVLKTDVDAIGELWTDRPGDPVSEAFIHDVQFSGASRQDKFVQARDRMKEKGADHLLLTDLADVAWILNIRAHDYGVQTTTVSFALIGKESLQWFVNPKKITDAVRKELEADGVKLSDYGEVGGALEALPEGESILLDPGRVNRSLWDACGKLRIIEAVNPVTHLKSIKNETELGHFRECLKRDGLALARFFCWLERTLGKEKVTEFSASVKLNEFRAELKHFRHDSFPAIMGYQAHGAEGHYRVTEESSSEIRPEGLLLLDSGGAYLDGTTDTTRVVALGEPTLQQKTDFTLVLKGVIELTTTHYPEGTTGVQLDALARRAMWMHGRSFGHGTGHGVGFFLDVHEGPQRISPLGSSVPLVPGMVTTIEPGIYRPGEYGIRIENMVLTVPSRKTEFATFNKFETLTMFPICRGLVDKGLMEPGEVKWLNGYHQQVREALSPSLSGEDLAWLERETEPI